ncbi:hypothetical protein [Candidatus Berkiella aquae]|uniref:Uncharacterized protein n=1 Tax=Candidatus Berkiella aquae TaxID=295108 RepID=A0A0Q9YUC6_9GAMM|nr:hypothetical protein [Candidatus Berkiella aquae]MCS5709980.1 hypothetical protein [Candidatus Berkiella aquae]
MSAVKALCQKIDKNFFRVLKKSALTANYLLADLYRFQRTAKGQDKKYISATQDKLKQKLEPTHMQELWRVISHMTPSKWKVLDKGTQKSLTLLQRAMLENENFLQALEPSDLLLLGKSAIWYREVLIALIRQHQLVHHAKDPFSNKDFSYRLVRQGGSEQNFLYVAGFIAKCKTLPIARIITLGSYQRKIAQFILKDLTNSRGYFPISSGYVDLHPRLRQAIANDWMHYFENYPLCQEDRLYLERKLPLLQKKYPEFKKVLLNNRVTRHFSKEAFAPQPPVTSRTRHVVLMIPPDPITVFWLTWKRLQNMVIDLTTPEPAGKPPPKPAPTRRLWGWLGAC